MQCKPPEQILFSSVESVAKAFWERDNLAAWDVD